MDSKAIIAIAAVAIVAIAAVAVFFVFNNGDNGGAEDTDKVYVIDTKLRVFGNANNDNYLDDDDLTLIKSFIDGKATWSSSTYPLADVNGDEKITQADYNLVKNYLDGKSGTMYYVDWDNKKSSVKYPLGDVFEGGYGVHTMFSTGLDYLIILGLYDKAVYMSNGDIGPDDLDTTLYPNVDKLGCFQSMMLTNDQYETFINEKIKITMGDKRFYQSSFLSSVEKNYNNYDLQVIKLPMNRVYDNGKNTWESSMITLGAMFNMQYKTTKYINYIEKVDLAIETAVAGADVGSKTFLMPYTAPGYDLNPMYIDAHGSGSIYMADTYTVEMLPLVSAVSVVTADGFDAVEAETIIKYNPDVLIIASFGYATSKTMTKEQYTDHFEDIAVMFRLMGYENPIYGIAFENCCMAGSAFILTLAADIWPDAFDEDEAWDYMYEYYHNFTNYKGSLNDLKDSKFAVWKYDY